MKRKLLSALLATAMTMTVVAGTGIAVSADGEAVVGHRRCSSDPETTGSRTCRCTASEKLHRSGVPGDHWFV